MQGGLDPARSEDSLAAGRDMRLSTGERSVYSIYGLTLTSDFPFANRLTPGSGTPDLTFTCATPAPLEDLDAEPIYASPPRASDGKSSFFLYRLESCLVLRWRTLSFYLWPDRIVCQPTNAKYHYVIEMLLLGAVFSCWLEWRGTPALHASAVVVDGRTVAFLATPSSGKSSIATALMQAGYQLLTDDVLPVARSCGAFVGHPAYPQMRVWPDRAEYLRGHFEDLDLVHPAYDKRHLPVGEDGFGSFCSSARPLACLYLPERRDPAEWGTRISLEPLSPGKELMALIQHSFVVRIRRTSTP